ncbi:tetratricopeptide repeat protein [Sorangium sp. So ce1335]|uniref:tetratricopeptide repeat protein n=1 Tax=Sorangium sp. So ce1335 TaxID=3133335 RepID=UPI003F5F334C
MSHRLQLRLCLSLALALPLPAVPAAAIAQPAVPTDQAKAAARALANKGQELFDARRYEEALAAFREAEAQVHAPSLMLRIARSCERLGRLIEARSWYQRIVDEPLTASAPPPFQEAQADARVELAALAPRIPSLEVAVTGAPTSAVELTLDGQRIDPALPVERDPGDYTLVAVVAGRTPVTRTIQLKEGTRERVTLVLAPPPAAAAPPADRSAAPWGSDTKRVLLLGGGITAGAAAAAGVLFTVLANNRARDAEALQHELTAGGQNRCLGDARPDDCMEQSHALDESVRYSNGAFWSFVGAGTMGLGTLLYGVLGSSSGHEARVHMTPVVGVNGVGLSVVGAF